MCILAKGMWLSSKMDCSGNCPVHVLDMSWTLHNLTALKWGQGTGQFTQMIQWWREVALWMTNWWLISSKNASAGLSKVCAMPKNDQTSLSLSFSKPVNSKQINQSQTQFFQARLNPLDKGRTSDSSRQSGLVSPKIKCPSASIILPKEKYVPFTSNLFVLQYIMYSTYAGHTPRVGKPWSTGINLAAHIWAYIFS